jgi:hypothetical protein
MNENSHFSGPQVVTLHGPDCRKILENVIEKRVSAIMSYLSKGKWHVAKVLLINLQGAKLEIECTGSRNKPRPINIQVHQPVGICFKYGYGKFVFDTTVTALEPATEGSSGGTVVLAVPDRIGVVQRRSYFRVNVPASLRVNVVLWHRSGKPQAQDEMGVSVQEATRRYFQGRLVDVSAGGAQVMVPHDDDAGTKPTGMYGSDFRKGQFIGLRFTSLPYERPLMFSAQIRNILPSPDHQCTYLCVQIVGLEASQEGREVLARLVEIVDRYHQINESSPKQQDMQRPHYTEEQRIVAGAG